MSAKVFLFEIVAEAENGSAKYFVKSGYWAFFRGKCFHELNSNSRIFGDVYEGRYLDGLKG